MVSSQHLLYELPCLETRHGTALILFALRLVASGDDVSLPIAGTAIEKLFKLGMMFPSSHGSPGIVLMPRYVKEGHIHQPQNPQMPH